MRKVHLIPFIIGTKKKNLFTAMINGVFSGEKIPLAFSVYSKLSLTSDRKLDLAEVVDPNVITNLYEKIASISSKYLASSEGLIAMTADTELQKSFKEMTDHSLRRLMTPFFNALGQNVFEMNSFGDKFVLQDFTTQDIRAISLLFKNLYKIIQEDATPPGFSAAVSSTLSSSSNISAMNNLANMTFAFIDEFVDVDDRVALTKLYDSAYSEQKSPLSNLVSFRHRPFGTSTEYGDYSITLSELVDTITSLINDLTAISAETSAEEFDMSRLKEFATRQKLTDFISGDFEAVSVAPKLQQLINLLVLKNFYLSTYKNQGHVCFNLLQDRFREYFPNAMDSIKNQGRVLSNIFTLRDCIIAAQKEILACCLSSAVTQGIIVDKDAQELCDQLSLTLIPDASFYIQTTSRRLTLTPKYKIYFNDMVKVIVNRNSTLKRIAEVSNIGAYGSAAYNAAVMQFKTSSNDGVSNTYTDLLLPNSVYQHYSTKTQLIDLNTGQIVVPIATNSDQDSFDTDVVDLEKITQGYRALLGSKVFRIPNLASSVLQIARKYVKPVSRRNDYIHNHVLTMLATKILDTKLSGYDWDLLNRGFYTMNVISSKDELQLFLRLSTVVEHEDDIFVKYKFKIVDSVKKYPIILLTPNEMDIDIYSVSASSSDFIMVNEEIVLFGGQKSLVAQDSLFIAMLDFADPATNELLVPLNLDSGSDGLLAELEEKKSIRPQIIVGDPDKGLDDSNSTRSTPPSEMQNQQEAKTKEVSDEDSEMNDILSSLKDSAPTDEDVKKLSNEKDLFNLLKPTLSALKSKGKDVTSQITISLISKTLVQMGFEEDLVNRSVKSVFTTKLK